MSPVTQLSILALASSVIATPYFGHKHGHAHLHKHSSGTAAPYPYPTGNATGIWSSTGLAPSSSFSEASPATNTELETQTETLYSTIHMAYQESAAPAYETGAASDDCADVTVTSTEKVTQYVTEGSAASSTEAAPVETSAPAYSSALSTEASPVDSSSASSYAAPAYSSASVSASASSSSSSSSEAAPVTTSSAPSYSAPASSASTEASPETTSTSSSSALPVLASTYSVKKAAVDYTSAASVASTTAAATSSAASSTSTSSSSSGKRGLAYNEASLTDCFSGSREVSWAYNWGSSSDGLDSSFMFIPTLWGTGSDFVGSWSTNAKSAISGGSTHLFSFNEPDHSAQANLAASVAATAYQTYMNPFKGQAQLCAPAVTNGGGDMGLTWLKSFLSSCGDSCHIDCINIHWYDSASNVDYFKSHVEEAIEIADGKPVYISEFGATGSDDEIKTFLETVMPWMDSNSNIGGYAYFMVEDGSLVSGSEPSTYGSTYMSYTS